MKLHIIYTEHSIHLSKKCYSSWRDIQHDFKDYKTSLGPWDAEEAAEYLAMEYSDLEPSAQQQVSTFVSEGAEVEELTFRERK